MVSITVYKIDVSLLGNILLYAVLTGLIMDLTAFGTFLKVSTNN